MKRNSIWIFLLILLILIARFTRQFTQENIQDGIVQETDMTEASEN